IVLPKESGGWQTFWGTILLISAIIILGSVVYYFYLLNIEAISLILLIIPICLLAILIFTKKIIKEEEKTALEKPKTNFKVIVLTFCFLFLELISFALLYKAATGSAIRSPWQVLPKEFFLIYFFSTLFLIVITLYSRRSGRALFLNIIHYFLSSSVALIIYRLGYGFDPFIHQATEKVIFDFGYILPKPFYYVGHYVLVVILAKIAGASVAQIDKFLVPVLFSGAIPAAIYFVFKKISTKNIFNITLPIAALILPYNSFIVTTPQASANIFILLIIILSLVYIASKKAKNWLAVLAFFTAATLFIHPLAGIPALIFLCLVIFFPTSKEAFKNFNNAKIFLFLGFIVLSFFIIPLIFLLNSYLNNNIGAEVSFNYLDDYSKIFSAFEFLKPYFKNHFRLIYDLVYLFSNNIYLVLLSIAGIGLIVAAAKKQIRAFYIYPLTFIILIVNYLGLQALFNFSYLIDYERYNYPARILEISFYFLLPLILYAFFQLFKKMYSRTMIVKIAGLIFVSLVATGSLYISYPRTDDYHLDRGYNITQADINAVRYINDTERDDYIVLANQMTSVAAIKEFGFLKYFPAADGSGKKYFYYPIPTGDPLYQFYLDMVYKKPTRELAAGAGKLVGVNTIYLILDNYWWEFDKLVEEAKQEADAWQAIDQGKAYVFRYLNKSNANP
ncbi:MAG: hypothetical protein AAB653_02735, partial [Patescibacteria group bacterium]